MPSGDQESPSRESCGDLAVRAMDSVILGSLGTESQRHLLVLT